MSQESSPDSATTGSASTASTEVEDIWTTDLDWIENDISEKYPGVEKRKPAIREDVFYGRPPKPLIVDKKYKSVDTSINKNDCLIHAFLIDVSPNFRKLTQPEKDSYADWFRRKFFINAFDPDEEEDAYDEVESTDFLGEAHIQKLIDIYRVNIIVFEKTGSGIRTSVNLGGVDNILDDEPFILIYNPGDAHFRGVREMPANKFFFDEEEGRDIAEAYAVGSDDSVPRVCPFSEGEEVLHEGQVKKIFEIVWSERVEDVNDCRGVRFVDKGPIIPLADIQKKPVGQAVAASSAPAASTAESSASTPTPAASTAESSASTAESSASTPTPPVKPSGEAQRLALEEAARKEAEAAAEAAKQAASAARLQASVSALTGKPSAIAPALPPYELGKDREAILKQWNEERNFANRDVIIK